MKQFAANMKTEVVGDLLFRRNPLYYGAAVRLIERLSTAPLADRRAFAESKLGRSLALHAHLPLLTKEELRENSDKYRRGPAWMTSTASTGGTTGVPLKMWRSIQCVTFEQACIDWLCKRQSVDLRTARIAVLRGDNIKDPSDKQPPFWKFTHDGSRMVMSTNHLDAGTIQHYRDALEGHKPDVFQVYPTSLESLCRLLNGADLKLHLPFVLTSSELLPTQDRLMAIETLGCRLTDYYGQAERVNFAYSEKPDEYFFSAAYAYNELLATDDERVFEIAGTPFWNGAMRLVRYRTGDLIRFSSKPTAAELEEVCFGVRPFTGILGRSGDYLVTPDGGHLMGIDHFPRDVDNVARMQVIQESRELVRVLYIAAKGFTDANLQQIKDNVAAKLPSTMTVQYEQVTEMERAASQKSPYVIKRPGVEG